MLAREAEKYLKITTNHIESAPLRPMLLVGINLFKHQINKFKRNIKRVKNKR